MHVVDIHVEHAVELLLLEDEQVIEALTPHTAEEALTDGIRLQGVKRSFENLDVTRLRYPRKAHPKFAVVITDEVLRSLSIGGSFPNWYVQSKRQWDCVSSRCGSLCESVVR